MYRIRSLRTVLWFAALTFVLTNGLPTRAEQTKPEAAGSSTAVPDPEGQRVAEGYEMPAVFGNLPFDPDRQVQRAVKAYWPQLTTDPAGHNTRIGYTRLLKSDLTRARGGVPVGPRAERRVRAGPLRDGAGVLPVRDR